MMLSSIQTTLADFITQKILNQPGRRLDPGEPLLSSGLIDSFHLIDLSYFIEDTYEVRLDDTELNRQTFDTLVQLANIILERTH